MAKDYAKRVFTTARKPKKKRKRVEFIIVPILLIAFILNYLGHIHRTHALESEKSWLAQLKANFSHKIKVPEQPIEVANKAQPVQQKPLESDVHFDFYNELPNMHVAATQKVEEVTSKVNVKTRDPEANPRYIVELGTFKDSAGAGQFRLSLLLSGFEADIVKFSTKQGEVYRVQRGPFVTIADAKKMQKQFKKKGIVCELKNTS